MAAVLARFLPLSDDDRASLDRFVRPTLRNWNGIEVGGLRPTAELLPA
jgi:L-asparaginase II